MIELALLALLGVVVLASRRPAAPAGQPSGSAAPEPPADASEFPDTPAPPTITAAGDIAPARDPAWYKQLANDTDPPATDAERAYHDEVAALIVDDPQAAAFLRYSEDV